VLFLNPQVTFYRFVKRISALNAVDINCIVLAYERDHYPGRELPVKFTSLGTIDQGAYLKRVRKFFNSVGLVRENLRTADGIAFMEFTAPTRGLLGFRSTFIVLTKGEGTMFHSFLKQVPYMGKIDKRKVGSMISMADGETVGFALYGLQDRGPLFVGVGTKVYEGMIIGEHNQGTDLMVNALRAKKQSNVRASGKDDAIKLTPPLPMDLEKALEYIDSDEYVEITPLNIRIRKKYLKEVDRKRNKKG